MWIVANFRSKDRFHGPVEVNADVWYLKNQAVGRDHIIVDELVKLNIDKLSPVKFNKVGGLLDRIIFIKVLFLKSGLQFKTVYLQCSVL